MTLSVRATFSTNARFQWVLLCTVGQAALRAAVEHGAVGKVLIDVADA